MRATSPALHDEDLSICDSSVLDVTTVNAVGQMQLQTVSTDTPFQLDFDKDHETLAVMMGGGQFNSTVKGTTGETYVGDCAGGFMTYSDYVESNTAIKGYNENAQWYVRLHGSNEDKKYCEDDDDSLSDGAIARISVGVIVGFLALGGLAYFFISRSRNDQNLNAPLNAYVSLYLFLSHAWKMISLNCATQPGPPQWRCVVVLFLWSVTPRQLFSITFLELSC
jgi:hypothetical protein